MDNTGKVAVITLTRDRPLAFGRCEFYLKRQTQLPDYWIIADSGKVKCQLYDILFEVKVIDKEPHKDKAKDFTGNLLNAISQVPDDVEYIIIFEDDDWYHPTYIETCVARLQTYDLIGIPYAIYYNVKYRSYRKNENENRASFCETAFNKSVLGVLKHCCEAKRDSAFVDSRLWSSKKFTGAKALFADKRLVVGIKGLPGFNGIGIGHRAPGYRKDPDFNYLRKLIGKEDSLWYETIKF